MVFLVSDSKPAVSIASAAAIYLGVTSLPKPKRKRRLESAIGVLYIVRGKHNPQ
jgi:hypothetical protein